MEYNHKSIEQKWKKHWEENDIYKVVEDPTKEKFYILDMFPYPSGAGLHVGHPLGYVASDIYSRFKRMNGFNVLHPMGFDAFGLPAEQYAIQTGVHPAISTEKNIKQYKRQLGNIGFDYDWSREVNTSDPNYYKWTQWIFLKLYDHYYCTQSDKARPITELIASFEKDGNNSCTAYSSYEGSFNAKEWAFLKAEQQSDILMEYRLAYRKVSYVNWCEELGTVLANDEVKDGLSERGGFPVEKKAMKQWSLRITAYAERLLTGLNKLEWSDALKTMQKNWIGKSTGAQVFFHEAETDASIEVFTTRPDTIYGVTFMVLAPEHDLVNQITSIDQKADVEAYKKYASGRSERDRMSEVKTVTGCFTGAYALHPMSKKKLPIYIADYVLKDYGTGAIMAVPSDDDRDRAFAEKFGIEIINVVDKSDHPNASAKDKVGKMQHSDFLNGMEVKEAIAASIKYITEKGLGAGTVNYRLRDANFSRQRYWGEPFPIEYDKQELTHALEDSDLPLELPTLENFKPASGGKSPLARASNWLTTPDGHTRETDTMPGFAGSSWYYLRYMDPTNDGEFAAKKAIDYWQEVDLYIGGTEHAVGHLMYSRFWNKFLYDLGFVGKDEPFKKLINQGMIQGVIESIYLSKEKEDGYSKFVCRDLAEDKENYIRVPIHIDFVSNYGSEDSYIDTNGIKKFIDWRPEYKDAIFQCGQGRYHKGVFKTDKETEGSYLLTDSEVGKMSKSKYNVVNPDDVVENYGADVFRMYEMFLGPIEQSKPWDMNGIDGVSKFLRKYWSLFFDDQGNLNLSDNEASPEEEKILHGTIKKVSNYVEKFSFNTAVSAFMICVNDLRKIKSNNREILSSLNRLLAPFAPFTSEEIYHILGNEGSIHHVSYPIFDEAKMKESSIDYPISVNGKKRLNHSFDAELSKDEIEKIVPSIPGIDKYIDGKQIRKIIVVPGRMVNVVVG